MTMETPKPTMSPERCLWGLGIILGLAFQIGDTVLGGADDPTADVRVRDALNGIIGTAEECLTFIEERIAKAGQAKKGA